VSITICSVWRPADAGNVEGLPSLPSVGLRHRDQAADVLSVDGGMKDDAAYIRCDAGWSV
jgi:hypothetical protein